MTTPASLSTDADLLSVADGPAVTFCSWEGNCRFRIMLATRYRLQWSNYTYRLKTEFGTLTYFFGRATLCYSAVLAVAPCLRPCQYVCYKLNLLYFLTSLLITACRPKQQCRGHLRRSKA